VDDAISDLRSQTADAPDSAEAHFYLGLVLSQKGQIDQAKGQLQEAVRKAPGWVLARQQLAQLYLAQGDIDSALAYARQNVQAAPGDPSHHMLLGSVYLRKGDSAKSRDEFLIAQKLLPNDFRVNLQIARTYAIEKKWADAEKEYGA